MNSVQSMACWVSQFQISRPCKGIINDSLKSHEKSVTRVQHTSLCESVTTQNFGKLQAFLFLKNVAQPMAVNV